MTDTLSFTDKGIPVINGKECPQSGTLGNTPMYDAGEYAIFVSPPTNGQIEVTFNNAKNPSRPHFIAIGLEDYKVLDEYAQSQRAVVNISANNPYQSYSLVLTQALVASMNANEPLVTNDLGLKVSKEASVIFYPATQLKVSLDASYVSPTFSKAAKENPYNPLQAQREAQRAIDHVLNICNKLAEAGIDVASAAAGLKSASLEGAQAHLGKAAGERYAGR